MLYSSSAPVGAVCRTFGSALKKTVKMTAEIPR
jgi:hypothetical protein